MAKLFANSGDPDQTSHSAASDLGLHCLPTTLLWVSRLQWVNGEQRPRFYFVHVQDDLKLHFLHMFKDSFSLDMEPYIYGGNLSTNPHHFRKLSFSNLRESI